MNYEKALYLSENMEAISKRDRIWMNNPVIMQGLGLAPLVVVATSGQNALMIAFAVLWLVTPTRLAGALLSRSLPHRFSILYYAGVACLLYIPLYYAAQQLFGLSVLQVGIYLPMLVMDPLVIRRYANENPEKPSRALRRGFTTTVGYLLVLMLMGLLREFLGMGTLMGNPVLDIQLFPLAGQPAGGFILVGVLCAIWRGCIRRYKKYVNMEAKQRV